MSAIREVTEVVKERLPPPRIAVDVAHTEAGGGRADVAVEAGVIFESARNGRERQADEHNLRAARPLARDALLEARVDRLVLFDVIAQCRRRPQLRERLCRRDLVYAEETADPQALLQRDRVCVVEKLQHVAVKAEAVVPLAEVALAQRRRAV